MNIFLSKYINKVDKKGRVSVPAPYRSILAKEDNGGIIAYPSFRNKCIEACGMSRLQNLNDIIAALDPYSSERDAFETVVLGQSIHLAFDNEGRVTLPSNLLKMANIENTSYIVGKGDVFEIWNPNSFEEYLLKAKEIAQNNRSLLKNKQQSNGG